MTERAFITTRLLLADGLWLVAAVVVAFAGGVAGDQFLRATPLGLHYRTAADVALQSEESETSIRFVGIDEMDELLGRTDVVTVDARPKEIFDLGHIPGARSLSRERFASDLAALESALRVPGLTIVVYCADMACPDGAVVAGSLREQGFTKLVVYEGGYDEWEASGRPVETAL